MVEIANCSFLFVKCWRCEFSNRYGTTGKAEKIEFGATAALGSDRSWARLL